MISVVVPVYKVEKYLDECIESIVGQSFQDFELILVDDGSPDRCGEICDEWAARDGRIKVVHKENGGLSEARNTGIERSTGQWLSFVDSDDLLERDMLQTLYTLAVSNDADIACCNYVQIEEENVQKKVNSVKPGVLTPKQYWEQLFSSKNWAYYNVAWNKLYRRTLFDTVRYPAGKINEDIYVVHDLSMREDRLDR